MESFNIYEFINNLTQDLSIQREKIYNNEQKIKKLEKELKDVPRKNIKEELIKLCEEMGIVEHDWRIYICIFT